MNHLWTAATKTIKSHPILQVTIILVAAFLLALVLGSGTTLLPGSLPQTELDLSSAQLLEGAALAQDGSLEIQEQKAVIFFEGVEITSRTVWIEGKPLAAGETDRTQLPVTATVELVAPRNTEEDLQITADQGILNPLGKKNTVVVKMRTMGAVGNFQITLQSPPSTGYRITAITLNKSGFSFNVLQFLLLSLLGILAWLVWHRKWYRLLYDDSNRRHRLVMLCMVLLCVACVLWVMHMVRGPKTELLWEYDPAEPWHLLYSGNAHMHYYHLFDALEHGQLHMREIPDPQLGQLQNPYDMVQREDIFYLWDFAYYQGNYYTYFGPAPMPLYFLLYGLTGKLPSPALACAVPAILAIWLLWGALRELLRYLKIKANLLLLFLSFPALVSGALVFLFASLADTYVQPYLWATCGLAGFLWAFYRALRTARPQLRVMYFLLAGGFVVLVAASRPACLLFCVVTALFPCLDLLCKKGYHWGRKVRDIMALLLPIIAGAAVLMAYNYHRFDSVFDFGNQYQLTLGDMRAQYLRLSPVWLVQALGAFLFWPLQMKPYFPYFFIANGYQPFYGNYFANSSFFGLISFPLYWFLATASVALRQLQTGKKILYIGWLVAGGALLWLNYCIGNLIYRYICDVMLVWGLLAVLVLLEVVSCKPAGQKKWVYTFTVLALAGTIAVGLLLCFENERNYIRLYSTDSYLTVAQMLRLG